MAFTIPFTLRLTSMVFLIIAAVCTAAGRGWNCSFFHDNANPPPRDEFYIVNWRQTIESGGKRAAVAGQYYVFAVELLFIVLTTALTVMAYREARRRYVELSLLCSGVILMCVAASLESYYVIEGHTEHTSCYVISWVAAAFFLWCTFVLLVVDSMLTWSKAFDSFQKI